MMNYTIKNIALLGIAIDNEDVFQVALANDGKYINDGMKNYFVLYVPRENDKSLFRDYICIPLDNIEDSLDLINWKVNLMNDKCKWIEYFIVPVDEYSQKYNYVETAYKAYVMIDSNTYTDAKEYSNGSLVNKRYDLIENDYLENRKEYDKILEKCIIEMKISGEDWWCECDGSN